MAETGAADVNTRSGPKQKIYRGHTHRHLEQEAARPLAPSSATGRGASLRRAWLYQRAVQVIAAPECSSGRSMAGKAGAGAK